MTISIRTSSAPAFGGRVGYIEHMLLLLGYIVEKYKAVGGKSTWMY
jgi:hypothetical protein